MKTLDAVLHEVREWRAATFPAEGTFYLTVRLHREASDLNANVSDKTRGANDREPVRNALADCMMTLDAIATAEGIDLAAAVEEKLAINRGRSWPR